MIDIKDKRKGFTLIEIMIVVGIIVILVTIAIPLMLRSRINANEAAALANIRTIYNSCQSYYSNILPHSYPPSGLNDLISPASTPAYIDSVLASGTKQGYQYSYQFINEEQFKLYANPAYTNRTGVRHFFVDETGVVRQDSQNQADENDPAVE